MNYNKNKNIIFEKVKSARNHPTAIEVFEMVQSDNPGIGIATIYRNLNELVLEKKLIRIERPYAKDRYDARVDDHVHVECSKCGKVKDVKAEVSLNVLDEIKIDSLEVKAFNTCEKCLDEEYK